MNLHVYHHLDLAIERKLDLMLRTLVHQMEKIMSAISDFATKMAAFFDRQDKAVADLQTEVKALTDEIASLQNSPGTISADDQASLDAIQARASGISDKLDALDTANAAKPALPPGTAG